MSKHDHNSNKSFSVKLDSNIYVLVYPEMGAFKLGKANNIWTRTGDLQTYWGKPEYEESYRFPCTKDEVYRLEGALKKLLHDWNTRPEEPGIGRTEFFRLEALEIALKFLSVHAESHGSDYGLRKGITPPVRKLASPFASGARSGRQRRKAPLNSYGSSESQSELDTYLERFSSPGDVSRKLHQAISFLHRNENRIAFQWDWKDEPVDDKHVGRIQFRVEGGADLGLRISRVLEKLQGVLDPDERLHVVCPETIGVGEVIQFEFIVPRERTQSVYEKWSPDPYTSVYLKTVDAFFTLLPRRSSGATNPLPVLTASDPDGLFGNWTRQEKIVRTILDWDTPVKELATKTWNCPRCRITNAVIEIDSLIPLGILSRAQAITVPPLWRVSFEGRELLSAAIGPTGQFAYEPSSLTCECGKPLPPFRPKVADPRPRHWTDFVPDSGSDETMKSAG